MVLKKSLLCVVLLVAVPAFCQTLPSGERGGIPLTLGAGYSNFNPDWRGGRISGYTLWADWAFYHAPGAIKGIAVEAFGRDLNFNNTGPDPLLRQVVGGGGILWAWRRNPVFQPYGKLLAGYGGVNFTSGNPLYTHDTRTVMAQGFGLNVNLHHMVIRADFETQQWPNVHGHHSMTPSGVTIGVGYDFKQH